MAAPAAVPITRQQIRLQPRAEEGWLYFAIGPNCWGKGKTLQEAFRNMRSEQSAGRGGEGKWIWTLAPEKCVVSVHDGALEWYPGEVPSTFVKAEYHYCTTL